MCGRYAVTTDPAKLAAEIDAINEVPDLPAEGTDPVAAARGVPGVSYNVAPTTTVMTVVSRHDYSQPDDDPRLRIRAMRWGLVPSWSKGPGKGPLLFNARAETAAQKSSFRSSVRSYRCLVPMDGWYEWKKGPLDSTGKPTKVPFFMSPRDGTRLFMAGLWSVWHPTDDATAPPLLSCSILTTDAVGALREVHDRMPLIMPFDQWDRWLDPDHLAPSALFRAPSAHLADAIAIREVSPLVNRVANNGPELLARV
ncbi:SOS response-associated peptidase [Gordonia pseudamarae]|jgi:putative SOS response-associated peptidase YedK|uniref:Abasic site processing protein n=1 Tax=Gordonia pseudamarae TaxID=2831662 RepID=A0ABX6ILW1_9ACTN|nr:MULTISPECIES: SOS response-associated peptidase [Gordonia]MBD0022734.1 SOS response-associated peptidase [Gordonia sp. (in: high G+C Gram-positive bacteria)]QHN27340.1 SOS response-associated peptidase [Gordonia pseudamarae]QHN36223.1 SOS response-associated peptidase [Gordonia pseudamarae]